ncbi:MAG TPA: LPS export ABC transporter periplasmic protein LptC [Woeseiaceae bacterium]|jgi:LPS export ABC transporter protein LptC|nr:LPS export ABC transporter periplasmic protein LptC [Woeseiaceae bacterium]
MSVRNLIGLTVLGAIAAATWYLAAMLREPEVGEEPRDTFSEGFYLRSARILGMGKQGNLLYEILADYAVQGQNDEIEFQNVDIRYSPATEIPWTLSADSAILGSDQQRLILEGDVRVVSAHGISGEATEIRTPWLELEPERYRAETDQRVEIRVGSRSLTATGMLALLGENRLRLKSNVSGRFVP